jgi:hypothetical protein
MKHYYFVFILAISFTLSSFGQIFYTKGRDFWLAFPSNTSGTAIELNINASVSTSGTVTSPMGLNIPFTVTAGVNTNIVIPATHIITADHTIENKGVRVQTADSVIVNAASHALGGADGITVVPVYALGTTYYATSYHNLNPSRFLIVATQNATTVTITPTATTLGGHAAGVPFNITLNQGQTYIVGSTGELSGSFITASAPISVTGTNHCAQIPTGATFCDFLWETLVPVNFWGTNFVMGHLAGRSNTNYRIRIVAGTNGTNININGAFVTTINAGQMYEAAVSAGTWVSTNNPVHVMQCAISQSVGGSPGDPFLATVLPTDAYRSNYFFATSSTGSMSNHYITITSPTASTGSVLVDGAPPAGTWTAIGASGWSYITRTLTTGQHTLTSTNVVNGIVYGWGGVTSYGYFIGAYKELVILPFPNYVQLQSQYNNDKKVVSLMWKDDNPDASLYYLLQKSADDTEWENITSHLVKESTFQYEDKAIQPSTSYKYRIKSIDKDGNFTYSNITEVLIPIEPAFVALYPNPAQGTAYLSIGISHEQQVACKIFNVEGKLLAQQQKGFNTGYHVWDISELLKNLNTGLYIILVQTEQKQFEYKLILMP